jgi:hypothetical protein
LRVSSVIIHNTIFSSNLARTLNDRPIVHGGAVALICTTSPLWMLSHPNEQFGCSLSINSTIMNDNHIEVTSQRDLIETSHAIGGALFIGTTSKFGVIEPEVWTNVTVSNSQFFGNSIVSPLTPFQFVGGAGMALIGHSLAETGAFNTSISSSFIPLLTQVLLDNVVFSANTITTSLNTRYVAAAGLLITSLNPGTRLFQPFRIIMYGGAHTVIMSHCSFESHIINGGGRVFGGALFINATRSVTISDSNFGFNRAMTQALPLIANGGAAALNCLSTQLDNSTSSVDNDALHDDHDESSQSWCRVIVINSVFNTNTVGGSTTSPFPVITGTGPLAGGGLYLILARTTWFVIHNTTFARNKVASIDLPQFRATMSSSSSLLDSYDSGDDTSLPNADTFDVKPVAFYGGAVAVLYVSPEISRLQGRDLPPSPTYIRISDSLFDTNLIFVKCAHPIDYPQFSAYGGAVYLLSLNVTVIRSIFKDNAIDMDMYVGIAAYGASLSLWMNTLDSWTVADLGARQTISHCQFKSSKIFLRSIRPHEEYIGGTTAPFSLSTLAADVDACCMTNFLSLVNRYRYLFLSRLSGRSPIEHYT